MDPCRSCRLSFVALPFSRRPALSPPSTRAWSGRRSRPLYLTPPRNLALLAAPCVPSCFAIILSTEVIFIINNYLFVAGISQINIYFSGQLLSLKVVASLGGEKQASNLSPEESGAFGQACRDYITCSQDKWGSCESTHKEHLIADHAEGDMARFGNLGHGSEEGGESLHAKMKRIMLHMRYTRNPTARITAAARMLEIKQIASMIQKAKAKAARIAAAGEEIGDDDQGACE